MEICIMNSYAMQNIINTFEVCKVLSQVQIDNFHQDSQKLSKASETKLNEKLHVMKTQRNIG